MENKGVLKIIIIVLILVLIATLVVGFLYIKKREAAGGEEKPPEEITYELEEFLVNLKPENNRASYLKIKVALMYTDKKGEEVIEANVNKIRDIVTHQLRLRTSKEILDVGQVETIKSDMVEAINEAIHEEVVQGIYFTDIVVQ